MKKLLLSSLIMFGVCGIASAQTDAKGKQKAAPTNTISTATGATTPQKAALMPASDAPSAAVTATSNDIDAAQDASAAKPARVSKTDATTVNAAGEVVPSNDSKKREEKMAAAKAVNAPKAGKQQK